jgi:methyl-accepting chemotaxis protein
MDRRKARVFKESFQLKIVRTLISLGIFSLVMLAIIGYLVLFWSSAARDMGLVRSGANLIWNMAKVFLIVTVILLGLVFWISYLISRNLFGPLTRLRGNMERLMRGDDPSALRFRKSDELEFHYISEPFNELVDRIVDYKKEVKELKESISDFLDKNKKGMIKKNMIMPYIEELKTKVDSLTKIA